MLFSKDAVTVAGAFIAAWNEPDPPMRRLRLSALVHEDIRYADAHIGGALEGAGHYLEFAEMFRERFPDLRLEARGAIDGRLGWFRFPWRMVRVDGATFSMGAYVGEHDGEGRIMRMFGFMDQ